MTAFCLPHLKLTRARCPLPSSRSGRSSNMSRRSKPSLVGLSRDALAEALGAIGVPERQQRMRVQQLWHWLYVRGAQDFDAMTNVVEGAARRARAAFHAGAAGDRRRADLGRRHAQVAAAASRRNRQPAARGRVRLHSRRPIAARCAFPARSAARSTCTFCHTGTQRLVRNLTPGEIVGQVVLARDRLERLAARGVADRRRREAPRLQRRHDGHGRAALQFRSRARRPQRRRRRRRVEHFQAAHHAVDLRRGAEDRARRRGDRRPCWRSRCTRSPTSCATSWCRSTANIRCANCSMPAATIPASPTRGASPSNMSCSRASTIRWSMRGRWCAWSRAFRPRST